jgi:hypothetical protein
MTTRSPTDSAVLNITPDTGEFLRSLVVSGRH